MWRLEHKVQKRRNERASWERRVIENRKTRHIPNECSWRRGRQLCAKKELISSRASFLQSFESGLMYSERKAAFCSCSRSFCTFMYVYLSHRRMTRLASYIRGLRTHLSSSFEPMAEKKVSRTWGTPCVFHACIVILPIRREAAVAEREVSAVKRDES